MRKTVVAGLVGLFALVAVAGSASAHPRWGYHRAYVGPSFGVTVAPPVTVTPYPYGYASPYYYSPPVVRVYPRYHHWHRWYRW
jgi:hypothetical protein